MRLLLAALVTAVVFSICDRVHIAYGVLTQTNHAFLGQAWWVLPLFFVLCTALLWLFGALRRQLQRPPLPYSALRLWSSLLVAVVVYVYTGPMSEDPQSLAGILFGAWLMRAFWRASVLEAAFAVCLGIFGPLGEAATSATGIFTYTHPDLLGVPIWLPAVYLHMAPVAAELDAWINGGQRSDGVHP